MLKIIQCGDLHLDSVRGRLAPEKAAACRAETRALLDRLAELAVQERVDLVLCTGDLFDTRTPYLDTCEAVWAAFAKMPCPVFCVPGNHDWYDARSPYAGGGWPANVHIFTEETLQTVESADGTYSVTGYAYRRANPMSRPLAGAAAPPGNAILLMHGELKAPSDYAALPEEDIAAAGFAYAAIGHIHQPQQARIGQTLVVQNGSIEGRGYDETGERGCFLVTLDGARREACHIPLQGGRAVRLTLKTDGESAASLAAAVAHAAPDAARTMVRLCLTGAGTPDIPQLRTLLDGYLDVKLEDRRTAEKPEIAYDTQSLPGRFIRRALAEADKADSEEARALLALALTYGLAAIENRDQPSAEEAYI